MKFLNFLKPQDLLSKLVGTLWFSKSEPNTSVQINYLQNDMMSAYINALTQVVSKYNN